jgi:hypothetical protein
MRKRHVPSYQKLAIALLALIPALALADASADLDKAISAKDKEGTKKALAAACSAGDAKAAATLLRVAVKLRELDVHDEVLDAIKGIKAEDGVKKLADAARSSAQAEVRYILVEGLALQGSGSPVAAKAVMDALDDKEDVVQLIAARSLRHCATADAVDKLIAVLEKSEKDAKEASFVRELNGALAAITGENLSFALEWKGWWMSHKSGWQPKGAPQVEEPKSGGDTVMKRVAKERPSDARTIERMSDDDVICVEGSSDKVQDILKAIGIKHTRIKRDAFDSTKLDPKSILILNCDGKGHPAFSDAQLTRIREFVEKGGYVFSSDWELEFTIAKAFPNSIAKGGESSKTSKDEYTVDIKPASNPNDSKHPFLRDVFPLTTWDAAALAWKMDGKSFLIKALAPDVQVLIESAELKKRFPENSAVAVTFRWANGKVVKAKQPGGKDGGSTSGGQGGCVLHVLSHFKHQKDKDSGDKFALQQLLLNFFVEKQAANKQAK